MIDSVRAMKEETEMMLNTNPMSVDSIEGWIIILVAICLFHSLWRKASKAASWCLCGLLFCQIMYIVAMTGFNDIIPVRNIFKYDIFTAVAQCFAGTKVCSILLWLNSFLIVTLSKAWDLSADFFRMLKHIFMQFFHRAKDIAAEDPNLSSNV